MLSSQGADGSHPHVHQPRNQSLDLCKLIASFLVVFAHVLLPDNIAFLPFPLISFAVPTFFAISGYFSFQAPAHKIAKRFLYVLKLNLIAILLEFISGCFRSWYLSGSLLPYLQTVPQMLIQLRDAFFTNEHPLRIHLWYLIALLEIYGILYLYTRFQGKGPFRYQPLYIVAVCLYAINLAFSIFAICVDFYVDPALYYNMLFYGLPMFCIGLFLRQYQDQILENFALTEKKLILLILGGILCVYGEWYGGGQYDADIYIGALAIMVPLMLLCISHPVLIDPSSRLAGIFAHLDYYYTGVYILHILMFDFYQFLLQSYAEAFLGHYEAYLHPFIAIFLSLAVLFLFRQFRRFCRRLLTK